MKGNTHALPGNKKSNIDPINDNGFEKEELVVEAYVPPDPGPYPQDKPKQNSVRFTPTQVLLALLFSIVSILTFWYFILYSYFLYLLRIGSLSFLYLFFSSIRQTNGFSFD